MFKTNGTRKKVLKQNKMEIIFKQYLFRNQTISAEEDATFLFEGTNTSNEEVKVTKVVTSCGCTSATYPKVLAAGQTFLVQVIIDKKGQPGNFNQSVTMSFSNGEQIKLKVNGTVEQSEY